MAKKTEGQESTERFMKEFFKDVVNPDTWESEKIFRVEGAVENPKRFVVDGYNEKLGIVWEYDGPMHYTKQENIEKDKKRDKYFISKEYKFIVIPYVCPLTKVLARHYLKPAFDSEKDFEKALANNYEAAREAAYSTWYPTPGWHGSPHTPFRFLKEGKERFWKEMNELPEESHHQIMHSLKLVLNEILNRALNNPLKKDIAEKIRNFEVNDEHIKGWKFKLDNKS